MILLGKTEVDTVHSRFLRLLGRHPVRQFLAATTM
jgi:hypothetical protein